MKPVSLFITYNPKSDVEQTLAVRLHTIGAVSGFKMFLPDRYQSETMLDRETKKRIAEADYFIMFSTKKLSKIVQQEIQYALEVLHDKSRVIVIYDKRIGKNIGGKATDLFTALAFDPERDNQDVFLKKIIALVKDKEIQKLKRENKAVKEENEQNRALTALFGIGLGLFVLDSLAKE